MPSFLKYKWAEPVLPPYDFSEALALPVVERFERVLAVLQGQEKQKAALLGEDSNPFSPGFAENEIAELERSQETSFAPEVKEFLRHWKFVGEAGCFDFHGADSWVENDLAARGAYLIIGNNWRYADGDQLVMPLSGETDKVFLYLHEHGPKIEEFAPSFSLALWRMAHEKL